MIDTQHCWWCGGDDEELRPYEEHFALCVDCHPWWDDAGTESETDDESEGEE
jgi:hypothetical protein